ncbi:hypothetical protein [Catellatospora methionotrophica]|uniref:hypothetical protein n=1 Tax=Catellatospora methionotrophica TaxID=121620 RepID=UPI00340BA554
MPAIAWICLAVAILVMAVVAAALWHRRARAPLTPEQRLRAARKAARSIRRDAAGQKPADPLHAPQHSSTHLDAGSW